MASRCLLVASSGRRSARVTGQQDVRDCLQFEGRYRGRPICLVARIHAVTGAPGVDAYTNAYLKALTGAIQPTHPVTAVTRDIDIHGHALQDDRETLAVAASSHSRPARDGSVAARARLRRSLSLGWEAPNKLDRAGWLAAGMSLAEFGRVSNWWVGDWIRYGNARWGEKYVEAARITGLDAKTLRNIAYVASRFDVSRRRDKLTWTHHAEVAALTPEQQEDWLDRALALRLSPGDLRVELRAAQRVHALVDATTGDAPVGEARERWEIALNVGDGGVEGNERADAEAVACPHCGGVIHLADIRMGAVPCPIEHAIGPKEQ